MSRMDRDNDHTKHVSETIKYQKTPTHFIFLSAICIIIMLSCISVYQIYHLMKANRLVSHTYQVISAANNTLYYLTYLETSQRGYLLFGDKEYLPNLDENVATIKNSLSILINLTKDNPSQNKKSINLSTIADKRIDLLKQISQIKSKGNLSSPEAMDLFQQSQTLSDDVRSLTNEIVQVEFALLNERNDIAIRNATFTNLIFVSGQVISIIFLLVAFLFFNRELLKRWYAENKIRSIESQLRSIIEGASDMIAALDLNYRFIIFNHAYEKEFQQLFDKQIYVGMSLDEALADFPEARDKLKEAWKKSLEGKEFVQNIQFNVHDKKIIFEVTSSLIKDNQNRILGAVHIKRNITERMNREDTLNKGMQELKDKNEKITILLEMSDVMLACNSLKELSEIIAIYCAKVLSFSKGIFYIMHSSKNFLEASANWGSPISNTSNFTQDQCWALRLGHIYHVGFSDAGLICDHVNDSYHEISYICIPLRAKNDIFGLLYVEIAKTEGSKQLTANERLLVNAFAELAALALANIRLRESLSYQSVRDPLTSLYNRRYLEEFLIKQIHQSERTKQPISVLMIDLDHFKRINDVHGHDAGDLILKQFTQLLINEIRPGDLAARYGGEEFIIVFYETDIKSAVKRANHIRKSVSLLHVKFGAQDTGKITVSIGISEYPHDGKSGQDLIEAADKALYVAKNIGRNKVVPFSEIELSLKNFEKERSKVEQDHE